MELEFGAGTGSKLVWLPQFGVGFILTPTKQTRGTQTRKPQQHSGWIKLEIWLSERRRGAQPHPRAPGELQNSQPFGVGMSEHPCDHHGEEILVAEAGVAQLSRVLLPEGVGEALQLHADVDEPVQLDTGIGGTLAVPGQQQLAELRAQVVAHLGESWEQGKSGLNLAQREGEWLCAPSPTLTPLPTQGVHGQGSPEESNLKFQAFFPLHTPKSSSQNNHSSLRRELWAS